MEHKAVMVEGMYVGTKTVNYYNVSPLIMSISNQKTIFTT